MKLIGKYSEFTVNDISLHSCSRVQMKHMLNTSSSIQPQVEVKEHKPRKYKKMVRPTGGAPFVEKTLPPDYSHLHKIVLTYYLPCATLKVYSVPCNAYDVRRMGLTPIDKLEEKEKIGLTMKAMKGETTNNFDSDE